MKRILIVTLLIAALVGFVSYPLSQADALKSEPYGLRSGRELHSPAQTVSYTFTKIADTTGPFQDFAPDPAISDNDVVAFYANLDAGGVALVKGDGGPLTTIADFTTNVPGFGTFGVFGFDISINSVGVVAFQGGFLSTNTGGVFTSSGGPVSIVGPPPANPNDPNFREPFIVNSGDVFMVGTAPNLQGNSIYVSRGGAPPILLYDSSLLPNVGFTHSVFGGVSANQAGTAAFLTSPTSSSLWFVFAGTGGPVTPITPLSISTAPDYSGTSINASGTVAFKNGRNFGATTIYAGSGAALTTIADNLGPYGILAPSGAAINDDGMVVFSADFDINPGTGAAGIFRGPDPVADKIIAIGDTLDGSTVRFVRCGRHSLNNVGQIAFTATLDNGAQGIYRADPINPNSAPVARCKDVTVSASLDCTAPASVDNGSWDPDGDSITITQSPPGPYSFGTTPVMLTVIDDRGVSSQCAATVTVVDVSPPAIACPSNIIQTASLGQSSATVNYAGATATDNCQIASVDCAPPSGANFPVGTTTVNCKATDAASNIASCAFTVTVRTPQQATQQVIDIVVRLINQGALDPFQGIILISKLQIAVQLMNKGLRNVAIIQLKLFIVDVNHLINSGRLSQSQGQLLIAAANEIIASLSP